MEKSIVEQFVKEVPDLIQLCVRHLLDKDLQIENTKREEFIKNLYKDEYRKLNKYDFRSMFDELSNTPMPANEKGRELKAETLLSYFRVYSEAINENETIRRIVKDVLENPTAYPSDSVETIFYNACLVVFKFAGMLQVFFALYQLDFKHIQESCGVYLGDPSSVPTVDEVAEFVGDTDLAESYLQQLSSFQPTETDDRTGLGTDEKAVDEIPPCLWTLENREKFQRFELKNVNYKRIYELLIDDDLGIMTSEIPFDYFTDIVQRAQFGRIYEHCDTKKAKFRMVVTFFATHTTDSDKKKEYQEAAALSMGFVNPDDTADTEKVGRFNVRKADKFRQNFAKIV